MEWGKREQGFKKAVQGRPCGLHVGRCMEGYGIIDSEPRLFTAVCTVQNQDDTITLNDKKKPYDVAMLSSQFLTPRPIPGLLVSQRYHSDSLMVLEGL